MRVVSLCLLVLAAAAAPVASAFETSERDSPWRLSGISADQRTLFLQFEGGGCLSEQGRPQVVEDARQVTIVVKQDMQVPTGENEACPAIFRIHSVEARLASPLDGRRVVGGPPPTENLGVVRAVPRVVGLHRKDATRLLRDQRIRVRVRGKGTKVVRQTRPGTRLGTTTRTRRVTVVVGPA